VTPEPQPSCGGSIRHGIPLRSTKRMPVRTARSGIGFRPAYWRRRERRFGSNGSSRFHSASSMIRSAMPDRLRSVRRPYQALSFSTRGPVR
jgi:hypothetical protein